MLERKKKYLVFVLLAIATPVVGFSTEMPIEGRSAIHIQREVDNATERHMVQLRRKQCVKEKEIYLKSRNSSPSAWSSMEKAIKKRRPGYDLDRPIAAEPKWSLIGLSYEDEYFDGDRYALYKKGHKYTISEDGACKVIASPTGSIQIDDGQYKYTINVTKGTGTKRISPLVHRNATDAMLKKERVNISPSAQAVASQAKHSNKLVKSAVTDEVAGQTCNYRMLAGVKNNKICYWSIQSHYPNMMDRPIVLKSVISLGKRENVSQAKKLEISRSLDDSLFEPPPNVKIEDRTSR